MLLKSQKVQINVRENLIGNQIQTTQRHIHHWVHDNEWKQTQEINTSQTTINIVTGAEGQPSCSGMVYSYCFL